MQATSPVPPASAEPDEGLPVSGIRRVAKPAHEPGLGDESRRNAADEAIRAAVLAIAATGDMDRARELVDLLADD